PPAARRSKLFGLGALPGAGPVTAQPSRTSSSSSNEVVPAPVETATSSTKSPRPCVAQSLTYVIHTSTCLAAYAPRLTDHCCQPFEDPEAAFHEPVVPVAEHDPSALSVW